MTTPSIDELTRAVTIRDGRMVKFFAIWLVMLVAGLAAADWVSTRLLHRWPVAESAVNVALSLWWTWTAFKYVVHTARVEAFRQLSAARDSSGSPTDN